MIDVLDASSFNRQLHNRNDEEEKKKTPKCKMDFLKREESLRITKKSTFRREFNQRNILYKRLSLEGK